MQADSIIIPRESTAAHADFRTVYDRNAARVYRICYLRLGRREDAEDAVQNVFVRYLRLSRTFESEEHEKAYFLRAAVNECTNMRKSLFRRHHESLDELPEEAHSARDPDPAEDLLTLLPLRYRDVMYLYYYEEYPTAQIAKILTRNESTVRTQLQTGRKLLRTALEKRQGKDG